ncbi:MAG: methyl-accepting chemotaxis protein, partial [Leptospira sp.]|nr:methyl-accepting chemotaxis protein [Leptospira sp.]
MNFLPKILIAIIPALFPAIFLAYTNLKNTQESINFIENELEGLELIDKMHKIHSSIYFIHLANIQNSSNQNLEPKIWEIDEELKFIEEFLEESSLKIHLVNYYFNVKVSWLDYKDSIKPEIESRNKKIRYDKLTENLSKFRLETVSHSQLILDPDLRTYFPMILYTLENIELFQNFIELELNLISRETNISKDSEKTEFFLLSGQLKKSLNKNILFVEFALAENTNLEIEFKQNYSGFRKNIEFLIDLSNNSLAERNIKISSIKEGYNALQVALREALLEGLLLRKEEIWRDFILQAIFGSIVVFSSIIIIIFVVRRTVKPLKEITSQMHELSQDSGDLSKRIKIDSQDEFGNLSIYFNEFLEKIMGIILSIRKLQLETRQYSRSMDETSTNLNEISQKQAAGTEEGSASVEEFTSSVENIANLISIETDKLNAISDNIEILNQSADKLEIHVSETNQLVLNSQNTISNARNNIEDSKKSMEVIKATSSEISKIAS